MAASQPCSAGYQQWLTTKAISSQLLSLPKMDCLRQTDGAIRKQIKKIKIVPYGLLLTVKEYTPCVIKEAAVGVCCVVVIRDEELPLFRRARASSEAK